MNVALRRKLLVIVIIVAVVLATVYGFLPKTAEVDIISVVRGPLQVTIEEEGRTRLKERYIVTAPTAGYMRRLPTKVGDTVHKGQALVELEPLRSQELDPRSREAAENTVAAAAASLQAAREREQAAAADADYAAKRLERMTNLLNKGSIAKDQFEQIAAENKKAQALRQSATAAVAAAKADEARARTALHNYTNAGKNGRRGIIKIPAPVSGSIFRVYRESEGAVNTGEPLLDIGDVKNLEVRVEVLSSDAVKIKAGTGVFFKRWGGEGVLTGVVRIVEPAGFTKISSLGVEEQRVLIIADITSPADIWRALGDGFRLEAHFIIWEGKNVLQVPTSSLFRSGPQWMVFVEEKGKARRRIVQTGQKNGLTAQIISGLREGEKVIVHPDDAISEGSRVRPRK